jgi:dolichol-phosphate mannosyltransferase
MIRLAWTAAVSFSPLPLRLSFFGAAAMTLVAIEETVRALVAHLSGRTVPGWTSLMVVVCLCNAALMIAVGLLGEYVAKIFEESKGRPLYVVADTWNLGGPPAPGDIKPSGSARDAQKPFGVE